MLIELEEIKTFIGIDLEDTEHDNEITALTQESEAMLYSILWVETLEERTVEAWCYFEDNVIQTPDLEITQIIEIWEEPYFGVINKDFIVYGKKIEIMTASDFPTRGNRIFLKYKAWYPATEAESWKYEASPRTKLALKYLASWLWNTKRDLWISETRVGSESYKFSSVTDSQEFKKIIGSITKPATSYVL